MLTHLLKQSFLHCDILPTLSLVNVFVEQLLKKLCNLRNQQPMLNLCVDCWNLNKSIKSVLWDWSMLESIYSFKSKFESV
jgi:hypothetical protein